MTRHTLLLLPLVALAAAPVRADPAPPTAAEAAKRYPWTRTAPTYESLATRYPPPAGFTRVAAAAGSYADWLRHLPLRAPGTPVRRYDGTELDYATAVADAVVDLDVAREDLQQCMDTLIRLRGEYHWQRGAPNAARFPYAGGRTFGFAEWRQGIRPVQQGRVVTYERRAGADGSRAGFLRYLRFMFAMTGTVHALSEPRVAFAQVQAGDFFVQPAASATALGHAVTVLDLARSASGEVRALLGEGYTPAMDMHVLKAPGGGAWYKLDGQAGVQTPLWTAPFQWSELRRFRN